MQVTYLNCDSQAKKLSLYAKCRKRKPLPAFYNYIFAMSSAYAKPTYGATEMMIAATTNIGTKVFSIVFKYVG